MLIWQAEMTSIFKKATTFRQVSYSESWKCKSLDSRLMMLAEKDMGIKAQLPKYFPRPRAKQPSSFLVQNSFWPHRTAVESNSPIYSVWCQAIWTSLGASWRQASCFWRVFSFHGHLRYISARFGAGKQQRQPIQEGGLAKVNLRILRKLLQPEWNGLVESAK